MKINEYNNIEWQNIEVYRNILIKPFKFILGLIFIK